MKHHILPFFRAVAVAIVFISFSACNGKVDQDLIDSITGKVSVEKITIDQDDFTMVVGESTKLTVVIFPKDATDNNVTWSSSDESVVIVSSSGKVMALLAGEARIIAKAGDKTDFITITVIGKGDPIDFNPSVTVGSDYVSFGKQQLKGEAFFTSSDEHIEYGFVYAMTAAQMVSNPSVVYADNIDSESNYSSIVEGLSANTTYYYRSFMYKDGMNYYGETKTFTTTIPVSSITFDKATLVLNEGETGTISVTQVAPEDAFDKTLIWSSSDESIATVDENGRVFAISGGQVSIKAFANDQCGVYKGCDVFVIGAVDLGLSVRWCSANLGSLKQDDLGAYFAWGETQTKTDFKASTYNYGATIPYLKYNSNDNKAVLDLEDDAANIIMGDHWRMPTVEEWKELIDENNCYWYRSYDVNDNVCWEVRSKKHGYQNKRILLLRPIRPISSVNYSINAYWTSSLNKSDNSLADCINLDYEAQQISCSRFYGGLIRPVKDYETVYVKNILIDETSLCMSEGETTKLSVVSISPSNAVDKSYSWSSSDESVAVVDQNGNVTAVSKGFAVISAIANDRHVVSCGCGISVRNIINPCPDNAVDLGLTVYWARCNVGATTPEEYGTFYVSGICELSDNFRVPTAFEWNELSNELNCKWEWTTYNGVNGCMVTSKKKGFTDKWIFVPAAGIIEANGHTYKNSDGFYWSSSFQNGTCYCVRFGRSSSTPTKVSGGYSTVSNDKCSIRPVSD